MGLSVWTSVARPPPGIGYTHDGEHFDGPSPCIRSAQILMRPNRIGDLAFHGEDGVESGHRLLNDHGDRTPSDSTHLLLVVCKKVLAVEQDAPTDDPPWRVWDETQESRKRRLRSMNELGKQYRVAFSI